MKDNYVAKNAHKFNRAATHEDRKKRERKGYRKHKKSLPKE
jgi:hypothetical protein